MQCVHICFIDFIFYARNFYYPDNHQDPLQELSFEIVKKLKVGE